MSLSITPTNALEFNAIGTVGLAGAEISAFDSGSSRLFVTSGSGLQVVDLSNPAAPALIQTIDLSALGYLSNDITSVAVKNGVVAVSLLNPTKGAAGQVVFLDAASLAPLGRATTGAHPDMVTFTPDGTKLLVANEGEYLDSNGGPGNAAGSITIIDLVAQTVSTARFNAFNGQEEALRDEGVRIFAGQSASLDLEPEYIAVSADGTTAMVTLQENNAVAIVDIASATVTDIVGLGTKDFSNLQADFSDQDGGINLVTGQPVVGLYMPDAIDTYESNGQTYYVIANEGDDRDDFLAPNETSRLGSLDLDDATFPDEADLKQVDNLGRLTVSNAPGASGDLDGDGDVDQIQMYGGRSFSILDSTGAIVFDSQDMLERIVAEQFPSRWDDTRSDNKGPEPEGVEIATIGESTYAFIGLERTNITVVFDVTDPNDVTYTGALENAGDISPEGGIFISAEDSPSGEMLFVVSNEVSSTVTVYEIIEPEDTFTLQLLHFADAEAGLLASDTAPNLAALVDAFDDDYSNTLILAGGDNYIPGPFFAAGTDSSVAATHTRGNNPGAADIEIHNRIGVEASTIGNHEFDQGTRTFNDAVVDAAFPYLSANLDFSGDADISGRYQETVGVGGLENVSSLAGRIVPSAVVDKGGEKIGLVGATTQILEGISSTGGVEVKGFEGDGSETNDMALLAAQLQPVIDDLISQGVNKIILMAHLQQIGFEQELATLLSGVDIILAAGSNTRLGDEDDVAVPFPGHAADFAGPYPIVTTGADGGTTLIVNTDNEFTYLGRLVIEFDAEGNIIADSYDPAISGAYASTDENVAEAWGVDVADLETTAFAEGTKGEQVADITEAVDAVIAAKDGEVFGFTNVYLEGERNLVRNQETNLGNISADANLLAASEALGGGGFVASLKNGGGIRTSIGAVDVVSGDKLPPIANPDAGKPEGGVSTLDIENSLRFNNLLMVFDTTAAGLKAILEHGVAVLGNQGRFPQLGGVSFSFDPDAAAGSRILNIALIDENGLPVARLVENGVVNPDAPATISVVTLNFLANGGDGYPVKANGENFRYLLNDGTLSAPLDEALDFTAAANVPANALGEQQTMKDFMAENHGTPETAYDEADTPASEDERIQNLNAKTEDTVFDGETIVGDATAESIEGTAGDDSLSGGDGADTVAGLDGNDTLLGGADEDSLIGGEGNDSLDGGTAGDAMAGGAGDDTYVVDSVLDSVTEAAGEGLDTVRSGISYTLGAEVENLVLTGSGGNTGTGNGLANTITGNTGANVLDGRAGADTMTGLTGNDTYLVDDAGDLVVEAAGGGTDLVISTVSLVLAAELENLQLAGNIAINGGGNGLANRINGNDRNNQIDAGAGNDTVFAEAGRDVVRGGTGNDLIFGGDEGDRLNGQAGNDTLAGDAGADIFSFQGLQFGQDVVSDFETGFDLIELRGTGFASTAQVLDFTVDTATGARILVTPTSTILLEGVFKAELATSDFVLA